MHLYHTEQVDLDNVAGVAFDVALCATGYERRATHLLNSGMIGNVRCRYAIGYYDRVDSQRRNNDALFKASSFEIVETNGDSGREIKSILGRALAEGVDKKQPFRVLIDYSSMTRPWFAAVVESLRLAKTERCECYFCYSPSAYSTPSEVTANASVGPVQGFSSLESPEKPTALILGLGYERERALGLKEYVDPAVTYAFYTDPSLDVAFTETVLHNNRGLLNSLPLENKIRHALRDLQQAGNLLESVCSALRSDYRIILAPMGVKPFALQCLLLASRFPDIDVWRVSPGAKGEPQPRPAKGPILILKTIFGAKPVCN